MSVESGISRTYPSRRSVVKTNTLWRLLSAVVAFAVLLAFLPLAWVSPVKPAIQKLEMGSDLRKVLEWSTEDVDSCKRRIDDALLHWEQPGQLEHLTLVIYHLGTDNPGYSYGIQVDNIAIFTSALKYSDPAFFIFQVLGGQAHNNFTRLLPTHLKDHMCIIDFYKAPYDISAHMAALWSLGPLAHKFQSVLLLNNGMRGPLTHRDNGQWLNAFSNMLRNSKVAIAGSRINCAKSVPGQPDFVKNENMPPHVQTHAFTLRTSVLPIVLTYQLLIPAAGLQSVANYINHAEVGMSKLLIILGYKMASLEALNYSIKTGAGINSEYSMRSMNSFSSAQCDMDPFHSKESFIFYKFGGTAAVVSCNLRELSEVVSWLDYMLLSETVKKLTLQLMRSEPTLRLKASFNYCREASTDTVFDE